MERLGKFIQERRMARGLRGDELAFQIGRAPSWVSRIETGGQRTLPDPEVLLALASVLDVTVADLLDAAGYQVTEPTVVRANPFESFDIRWHVVEALRPLDIDDEENEWLLQMVLRELRRDENPRVNRQSERQSG